ncbi:MAG: ATP-dependent RNA helicase DbpA [Gammaproteobacteria bacterium]|nr:ATP-dependent RNA helicase DbpA [Gammaproteobacteria bacterium]NNC56090.1 ATP-dependent RNA helicase DbpA [Woeseiaceae bacterium]
MSNPTAFSILDLKPALLGNLAEIGYTEMTLVQGQTLPPMLSGADVLARAKTGSGKTAAFGLSLLNKLDNGSFRVQALVLCPTRELADQVAKEIRRLARAVPNIKILTLCGGVPLGPQLASLQHSPHVIVGTPGRVLKHLGKGSVALNDLQTLVLDEADRMLDMGFMDELDAILAFVPADRQTLLFSATYPDAIADISARVQRAPLIVDVTDDERPALIEQYWCSVTRENRNEALLKALRAWGGSLNLVFCNTKIDCADVAGYLQAQGVGAIALHGDLDQPQRTQVLVRFANRSASVLIATDVAARGLDVDDLDAVFNYELPAQAEVYIHRIGRTGRAGNKGLAVSLVEERETRRLLEIEALLPAATIKHRDIPGPAGTSDALTPIMTTVQISGGRKNKLRPGDLLGALTAKGGVPGEAVGSIDLFDTCSYVAVSNAEARKAAQQLTTRPIKGKKYRARIRK